MSVQVQTSGGVMTIRLNRPRKRNAFDGQMLTDIEAGLEQAERDANCRVVVLAGEGKAFCAGADLAWMASQAAEGGDANVRNAHRMGGIFHRVAACSRPVVARVQGATMGGGVGLASACDVVVASEAAFFALSEVRIGLIPAVISPFVMRRVGPAKGRMLFLTGARVRGAEAHRIGLVDVLTAHDEEGTALDSALRQVISDLLAGGPEALTACKTLVDAVAFRPPGDVLDITAAMISERRVSSEAAEGITAFLGKLPAPWLPTPGDGEA